MNKYILLILVVCILSGCAPDPSRVPGTYVRTTPTLTETLVLKSDGTFEQTIVYKDGQEFSSKGPWELKYARMQFDDFYMTVDSDRRTEVDPPRLVGLFMYYRGGDAINGNPDGGSGQYIFHRVKQKRDGKKDDKRCCESNKR